MKDQKRLDEDDIKKAIFEQLSKKGYVTNLSCIKLIVQGRHVTAVCDVENQTEKGGKP